MPKFHLETIFNINLDYDTNLMSDKRRKLGFVVDLVKKKEN